MNKERFLRLCRSDPGEVFKIIAAMGETISVLTAQVEALKAENKDLKVPFDKIR